MIEVTWIIPRKLRAVFSYRVAIRRYTFSLARNRSARFRSLYFSRSMSRCTARFLRAGITAPAPRASISSTNPCLSYPLSAIATSKGTPSMRASAWVTSAARPGVRISFTGSPSPFTPTWTLVPNPPRLRPDACSSWPPLPSTFFRRRRRTVGADDGRVEDQPLQVGVMQRLEQALFQLPNRSGRPRQGAPVLAIPGTASTNRRLSLATFPGRPGRRSLIRSQSASEIAWRCRIGGPPCPRNRAATYPNHLPAVWSSPRKMESKLRVFRVVGPLVLDRGQEPQ